MKLTLLMLNNRISKGIVLALVLICLFLLWGLPNIYRFLSEEKPVQTDVLIVQGWLYPFMYDEVAKRIHCDSLSLIIVTGKRKDTLYGKSQLIRRGICPDKIDVAPYDERLTFSGTFQEAYTLRTFLKAKYPGVTAVNIFTISVHGRKSLVMFKRVLGKDVEVGVLTCKKNAFDETRLWHSWMGISLTIKYFIGYLYALVWPIEESAG
ncbi:MAG TPA: hypothetical protein VJ280_01200 [Dehalococcoidales bacterium]|nr:hypothetical protein [Dehalococcoidales bacterium]